METSAVKLKSEKKELLQVRNLVNIFQSNQATTLCGLLTAFRSIFSRVKRSD
jgi:hypothetical protein